MVNDLNFCGDLRLRVRATTRKLSENIAGAKTGSKNRLHFSAVHIYVLPSFQLKFHYFNEVAEAEV